MGIKKTINLSPLEMTPEIMQMLENKGLIIRLLPGHHDLDVPYGQTLDKTIYECDPKYGGHKLIIVIVNNPVMPWFGSHPDAEDVLLIGDPYTKPIYMVFALCTKDELNKKIKENTLADDDFITLRFKYHDTDVSFFSVCKDVPHGEFISSMEGKPGSFYVTEPVNLTLETTDFGDYELAYNGNVVTSKKNRTV